MPKSLKIFLIVSGIIIIFVAAVSYFTQGWPQTIGGVLRLLGTATAGVMAVVTPIFSIINDLKKGTPSQNQTNTNIGGAQVVVVGNGAQANSTFVKEQHIHALTPEAAAQDMEKARKNYLQSLSTFCQVLPLDPLQGKKGERENVISLDDVYIDLDTTQEVEDTTSTKKTKVGAPTMLGREKEGTRLLKALEAAGREEKMALLGDPGAGKSTFVKKLCGWLACVHLDHIPPPPGIPGNLLPIYTTLRELAQHIRSDEFENWANARQRKYLLDGFDACLVTELDNLGAGDFKGGLQDALKNQPCLLVLDGLDEVPFNLRARVGMAVKFLLEKIGKQQDNHSRVIVTCRVRSYAGDATLAGFKEYILSPLDEQKIKDFIKDWYKALEKKKQIIPKEAEEREEELAETALKEDMRTIASNPMLLTVMALIQQSNTRLPKQRVRLFKLAVEVLMLRWQRERFGKELAPSAELCKLLEDENRLWPALELLAYHAQLGGEGKKEGKPADLLRKDAIDLLDRDACCGKLELAGEFLDYVDQRAGLLVGKGGVIGHPVSYSFAHRTFQEYLAGRYLIGQEPLVRTLVPLANEGDNWDLIAQLTFEELYYNYQRLGVNTLLEIAYALCAEADMETEPGQRLMLWAGQIAALVEIKTIENDKIRQEGAARFLKHALPGLVSTLGGRLQPLERGEAGRCLAHLGDQRTEVMHVDEMRFCFVAGGPFQMGSNRKLDKQAEKDEEPQGSIDLPAFWAGLHPVSNAQFNTFVDEEGYSQAEWWEPAKTAKYWDKDGFKGWRDSKPRKRPYGWGEPFCLPNHPVVGVSWYEAVAYCMWVTARWRSKGWIPATWEACLPNEAEWEKAARGGLHIPAPGEAAAQCISKLQPGGNRSSVLVENPLPFRIYPWNNVFADNRANTQGAGIGSTSALGCFPEGVSPYGILDLSGNVWEWTKSAYLSYPFTAAGERHSLDAVEKHGAVLRGGAYYSDEDGVRCARRGRLDPNLHDDCFGFRVFLSPSS